MTPLRRTLQTVRTATALAPTRPAYAAGARAAVATVLPLVVDLLFATGGATWMSLGGFNGALADRGGPYRTRAATMGAVTLGGAAAVLLGGLVGGRVAIAVPIAFVVALAACLARVWGAAGASAGGASLSAFVISLAFPAATPREAAGRALFTIVGGLWAMTVALVLWPLRPFRPARLAVAACYRALALYADEVAQHVRSSTEEAPAELPAGSAAVRAALEEARGVLAQLRRGRPGATGREERLIVLGEGADQLFGHLVAVAETVDSIPGRERVATADAAVADTIAAVAAQARGLAERVLAERATPRAGIVWSGEAVRAALRAAAGVSDGARVHYRQAAAMLDRAAQFAEVAVVTASALDAGGADAPVLRGAAPDDAEERVSPLSTVLAILAPDSLILRYALRVAVVVAAAVAITELLQLKRGYWLTITVIVIMQPYTGATTHRALQRVLGTVLGGLLTAALGALFHDPRAILLLSFVFAGACVALLPLNYAAYSVFLTPTFVLLAEAGAGDWHLATTRVVNTLLGGALALAGSRLLWPSPEWTRLPGYMAAAIRANRDYLRCVIRLYDDRSDGAGARIRAARRRIGLATVNAEESFQRLLGEYDGPPAALSPAMTFLTYTRRLTASTAALALARHAHRAGDGAEPLVPFADVTDAVLGDLAEAVTEGRRPAPLPLLVTNDPPPASGGTGEYFVTARLDRLARQIRLLHDAIDRWTIGRSDGLTGYRCGVAGAGAS